MNKVNPRLSERDKKEIKIIQDSLCLCSMRESVCVCVCMCVRACVRVYVRVCVRVCVVSVIVKRPVLPPSVVDGRSRNPLYYY